MDRKRACLHSLFCTSQPCTDLSTIHPQDTSKPRLLLLTKDKKVPLLWKVLANNFRKKLSLGVHKDEDGEAAEALGHAPTGKSMVLVFPEGETRAVVYEGELSPPFEMLVVLGR